MSSPAISLDFFKPSPFTKRLVYAIAVGSLVVIGPFLLWPALAVRLFGSNDYLPHVFCYLRRPALVWTHVTADSLIGLAYLAISVTLAYLVYKARRDIPFHWIFSPSDSSSSPVVAPTSWKWSRSGNRFTFSPLP
jgi:hypothetical protein